MGRGADRAEQGCSREVVRVGEGGRGGGVTRQCKVGPLALAGVSQQHWRGRAGQRQVAAREGRGGVGSRAAAFCFLYRSDD